MILHWFLHYTGSDNVSGPWYGFFSGFGSDLTELALLGAAVAVITRTVQSIRARAEQHHLERLAQATAHHNELKHQAERHHQQHMDQAQQHHDALKEQLTQAGGPDGT